MRNTIKYYYNIYPEEIYQKKDIYIFKNNNQTYWLLLINRDIQDLLKIYSNLITYNFYCHEIIYNQNNEIITIKKNKKYILIKLYNNSNETINLPIIRAYNLEINTDKKCNWFNLWCNKVDYYEYHISQNGKKYPLLKKCFDYYIGLTETAISLVKSIDISSISMFVNHDRININTTLSEFYNPLNFLIDVKIRDVCEYFKSAFFSSKKNIIKEIETYLVTDNISNEEAILFLARTIYPSYFYDTYDLIIQNQKQESDLYFYINKNKEFEIFLKDILILLKQKYNVPIIEWIIKT